MNTPSVYMSRLHRRRKLHVELERRIQPLAAQDRERILVIVIELELLREENLRDLLLREILR